MLVFELWEAVGVPIVPSNEKWPTCEHACVQGHTHIIDGLNQPLCYIDDHHQIQAMPTSINGKCNLDISFFLILRYLQIPY